MKKWVIILIILAIFTCRKQSTKSDEEIVKEYKEEIKKEDIKIDFENMREKLNNADDITVEVFFAISVLHRNYINQFEKETEKMTRGEKREFYDKKGKEFFSKIKYTREEYDNFMKTHSEEMNEYINKHPEIRNYITSY